MSAALWVVAGSLGFGAYAYAGYPLALWVLGGLRRRPALSPVSAPGAEWPAISIVIAAYNEEAAIGPTLERILALDYPPERRQIVVVSDASTDGTDAIVAGFADRGVEAVRLPVRGGKTAAENAIRSLLRGEIVVNTDASTWIPPQSIKLLIAPFADPTVGVASGRDVSVGADAQDGRANIEESGYVGYEMWVRDLETRVSGIVGASGCFYAIRASLHRTFVPEALSRDFASALTAREHGYRAVSVPAAICLVPRTGSLQQEYRRKVRTISRGMETLAYKRHLLTARRHALFAWMLVSHKVCRWALPWVLLAGAAALGVLASTEPWAALALGAGGLAACAALVGWRWPTGRVPPRLVSIPAYVVWGNVAAMHAAVRAMRRELSPTWEPTRRGEAAR